MRGSSEFATQARVSPVSLAAYNFAKNGITGVTPALMPDPAKPRLRVRVTYANPCSNVTQQHGTQQRACFYVVFDVMPRERHVNGMGNLARLLPL